MINPNNTINTIGKIESIETFTSMSVYKINTKHGIFDYTVFGMVNPSLDIGVKLNVAIGYSIMLNAYTIKYINNIFETKAA